MLNDLNSRHGIAVVSVFFIAALACSTQLWAADRALCDAYVSEALSLAKQVRKDQCGFDLNNPQWSTDPNAHRRWCINADVGAVDQERQNRRVVAQICSGCRAYAQAAMRSIEAAAKNGCQVSGGARCVNDEWAHYSWCAGLGHYVLGTSIAINSETDREAAARAEELGACVATKTDPLKVAKPEVAQPFSSSRTNTSRSVPSEPWSKRLRKSNPHRQGAKLNSNEGKVLQSSQGKIKRSAPCLDGQPCAANRGPLNPGLLEGGGGFPTQAPSATGTRAPSRSGGSGAGALR